MDTTLFYNLELEQDIKDVIGLIEIDPSKENKKILIDLFNNKFQSNRSTFYEMTYKD